MTISERSTRRTRRYFFSSNALYCTTYKMGTVQVPTVAKYEFVSSYRGKPVKLKIGGKVRKRFNAFERYSYELSPLSLAKVCVINADPYIGWVEDFPLHDVKNKIDVTGFRTLKGVKWDGDVPPCYRQPLAEIGANLRDFATRDAFVKLNSPDWNAAVFLAELGETVVGIHDLLFGAAKVLLRAGYANSTFRKLLKEPESLWLWYRYMLLPLMLETEALIALLTTKRVFADRIQDGDRSAKPEITTGVFELLNYGYGLVDVQVPWKATTKYGSGCALDIVSRYDPAPYGTSLSDVIAGAWEVVPKSFVLDWFINIGDWLTNLRSVEYEIAQSYCTSAVESTVEFLDGTYIQMGANPFVKTFLMNRVVDVKPSKIPLVDSRWNNILRTLDATALIIGAIKGVLRRHK